MDKLLLELKITYYGCESDSRSATGSGFQNTVKNIVKGINSIRSKLGGIKIRNVFQGSDPDPAFFSGLDPGKIQPAPQPLVRSCPSAKQ